MENSVSDRTLEKCELSIPLLPSPLYKTSSEKCMLAALSYGTSALVILTDTATKIGFARVNTFQLIC